MSGDFIESHGNSGLSGSLLKILEIIKTINIMVNLKSIIRRFLIIIMILFMKTH